MCEYATLPALFCGLFKTSPSNLIGANDFTLTSAVIEVHFVTAPFSLTELADFSLFSLTFADYIISWL